MNDGIHYKSNSGIYKIPLILYTSYGTARDIRIVERVDLSGDTYFETSFFFETANKKNAHFGGPDKDDPPALEAKLPLMPRAPVGIAMITYPGYGTLLHSMWNEQFKTVHHDIKSAQRAVLPLMPTYPAYSRLKSMGMTGPVIIAGLIGVFNEPLLGIEAFLWMFAAIKGASMALLKLKVQPEAAEFVDLLRILQEDSLAMTTEYARYPEEKETHLAEKVSIIRAQDNEEDRLAYNLAKVRSIIFSPITFVYKTIESIVLSIKQLF